MTQLNWTKEQLVEYGRVSRNDALKNYFSRLGARVDELRHKGWVIKGEWVETKYGRDYVYTLISKPEVHYRVLTLADGTVVDKQVV